MSDPADHPRPRARPLRMRLLLLAASGLVPLVLMLGWGLKYLVDERRAEAERSVTELSRALATAVDAELHSIAALLENISTSDELERADLRSFYFSARRTADQFGWRSIVLADGEGRILFRTTAGLGASAAAPVEPESLALTIKTMGPVVGRVTDSPAEKSSAFAVRVPVVRSGKVVYVLSAVLPTDVILNVLTRQNIPTGSLASVFDSTQHRVARSTVATKPFPSESLKRLMDRDTMQGAGRTLTREGVEYYSGFTRLHDSGWVVVVGTSVEETNKGLYGLLSAVGLGLAASLGLSVLLAWVLSRRVLGPIESLKNAASALGRGQPVNLPPLHIVELDDVAVALKDAAADRDRAMQERDRSMQERERAATERERLAAQIAQALHTAEEANRSKDQFLAMLGHELRNPLAPITTAVQIMALKGDDRTANERRVIERQLVHVTRLVDDLLDVSRITSRRLAITKQPVHLGQVLTQVVETIQPSMHQRLLTLDLSPSMQDSWVAGDEVRLVQVFNNLLVNAIKFTPAGGSSRVKASVSGHEVRVDVQDTGVGIEPGEIGKVFDLFYQAPQSADRARGGLWLGLPIVRSLVEMHGGTVEASSEGSGEGTCVTVRLPLGSPPASQPSSSRAPASRGAGQVLVVDDNEDAADTCAALLEMSGYTVQVAYSPAGALEALATFRPDVAVLDIGLPGMSGYALAGHMKAPPHHWRGKLVALTGYGQAADMAASRDAGFDAHVTKPVVPDALLELVARLVRERAQVGDPLPPGGGSMDCGSSPQ